MSTSTKPREPLEKLKTYPAFQNLRAKAERHALQFRPKESEALRKNGDLDEVLDSRTMQAWNAMADAMRAGAHLNEAEEVGLPNILLPSEADEDEEQEEINSDSEPTSSQLNPRSR